TTSVRFMRAARPLSICSVWVSPYSRGRLGTDQIGHSFHRLGAPSASRSCLGCPLLERLHARDGCVSMRACGARRRPMVPVEGPAFMCIWR
ncbi:hypothetical protein BaRGS_00005706, partial [Batillaria attramentaria]